MVKTRADHSSEHRLELLLSNATPRAGTVHLRSRVERADSPWRSCYISPMKAISQHELRNHNGEILRQAETGQQFTITVDGRPVAVLGPYPKRQWVPKAEVLKILRSQPSDPTFVEDLGTNGGTLEDLDAPWESSKRGRRHAEIAAFAKEHAGTSLDLDRDLEAAGTEAGQ